METLSDLVFRIRESSAGRPDLLSTKRGGRLQKISTSEFLGEIHALALAFEAHGVQAGDRIAILSENRPEWHVIDFACHLIGAVSVPIYATLNDDQVGYIVRNSGASWIFYSDEKRRASLEEIRGALTRDLTLVAIGHEESDALSLVQLLGEGSRERSDQPLERFKHRVQGDDLASIIYTSGTTGDPKGVMLTHWNFVSNIVACKDLFELGPEDQALSFLPLSHVFERTVDHMFFYLGVKIHYAPSIERVPPLLLEIKPTVLSSVPRLYERAYLRVKSNLLKEKPAKQKIFNWGVRVGSRYATASLDRFIGPILGTQRYLADRLVFSKIKERFGGRLRFAISGGAPIGSEVAEFFDAVGIRLYQGYGLTETAPVLAVNHPTASRRGSVGPAAPGIELRIADDGEILAKTPGLMQGYWDNEEATREVINEEGWFHTGDIGELDEDGFLFITDRKKDLIITSGGKNVAPQPIEQLLSAEWCIAQAVVVGDRYPYIGALLVPRFEDLPEELRELDEEDIPGHSELRKLLQESVSAINSRLNEHERVRKFAILPRELTLEAGEITPTMKVKRKVVLEKYGEEVSSLYLKTQKL